MGLHTFIGKTFGATVNVVGLGEGRNALDASILQNGTTKLQPRNEWYSCHRQQVWKRLSVTLTASYRVCDWQQLEVFDITVAMAMT